MTDAIKKRYDRYDKACGVLQEESARLKDSIDRLKKAARNTDVKWTAQGLDKVLFDLERSYRALMSQVNKASYCKVSFWGSGDGT